MFGFGGFRVWGVELGTSGIWVWQFVGPFSGNRGV